MYLIIRADRNAGDLHLNQTRTDTSRCKQLAPFVIAERFSYRQAPSDPIILSAIKNQLFIPNAITAAQWRKGRNEQVNIQQRGPFIYTRTYASKAMNGGRGQDTSKTDLQPLSI